MPGGRTQLPIRVRVLLIGRLDKSNRSWSWFTGRGYFLPDYGQEDTASRSGLEEVGDEVACAFDFHLPAGLQPEFALDPPGKIGSDVDSAG